MQCPYPIYRVVCRLNADHGNGDTGIVQRGLQRTDKYALSGNFRIVVRGAFNTAAGGTVHAHDANELKTVLSLLTDLHHDQLCQSR